MPKADVTMMPFAKLYPLLVAKAERKGRTREEVDQVTTWLTQRETACRVTWTFSASCSWEKPRLARSSRRISLGSILITTLPEAYHTGNKKQSNRLLLLA